MILVTGATGLVGAHLLLQLTRTEERVVASYRNSDKIELVKNLFGSENRVQDFLKIEWVQADLNDIYDVENLIKGKDFVFNCAALVSFNPKEKESMLKNNCNSTANIVNQCLLLGVKKLIHVSSVASLGSPESGKIADETCQWKAEDENSTYALSKYLSENEVWRGIEEGLNAVIVNPSIILGEGFWETSSGKMFSASAKGFKFYSEGVSGFVDVKDVAKAMLMLKDRNEANGKRYLLSAENLSYKEFFFNLHKQFNQPLPTIKITASIAGIAWRVNAFICLITGSVPQITKETALAAVTSSPFNGTKISTEFPEFTYTAINDTLNRVCNVYMRQLN